MPTEKEIVEESGKGPREWGAGPRGPGEKVVLSQSVQEKGFVFVVKRAESYL